MPAARRGLANLLGRLRILRGVDEYGGRADARLILATAFGHLQSPRRLFGIVADAFRVGNRRSFEGPDVRFRAANLDRRPAARGRKRTGSAARWLLVDCGGLMRGPRGWDIRLLRSRTHDLLEDRRCRQL